jgi:hypothetical protein
MTAELHEPARSWRFELGEPYWAEHPDGPKYGDLVWDLRGLNSRTNMAMRNIDMTDVPLGYMRNILDVLMLATQPDHPTIVAAGIVRRAEPARPVSVYGDFRELRMMALWGQSRGLWSFSAWTQQDADALLEAMMLGTHREGGSGVKRKTTRRAVTLLKDLYDARVILSEPIMFQPWGDRTPSDVAEDARAPENETPPLPWETWAPLVTAAWAFVDRFSPDILEASKARASTTGEARGPTADAALERLAAWFDAGGRVPLKTGLIPSEGERGSVNRTLLLKQVGIGSSTFNEAAGGFNPRALRLLQDVASDPARCQMGGQATPTVLVTQPDGTALPWVSEIGPREAMSFVPMLRAACFVIIASLTGMRDSEIQELQRGCVTTADGLPALRSVQFKGRAAQGEERTWWAPEPVLRACEVLEQLTPHRTALFARSSTEASDYNLRRDVSYLLAFINAAPEDRIGRGAPLGLDPIVLRKGHGINATSLRRSLSVYSTTRPGAELGLGIQLGHAAWRKTSGYMADGKQVAVRHLDDHRKELFRASAAELITGDAPLAGPAAKVVDDFRAQIIADPTRAKKVTDRAAEQIHYGLTNDCLWRPDSSACGADRPKLADHLCAGGSCANALYTPAHERILLDSIARFDEFLDSPGPRSPQLKERMGKDRANIAKVLRELRRATTDGDDT